LLLFFTGFYLFFADLLHIPIHQSMYSLPKPVTVYLPRHCGKLGNSLHPAKGIFGADSYFPADFHYIVPVN